MAMDPTRLTGNLATDYLSQLQTQFSFMGLLPAEQALLGNDLQKLANALANAGGPDIVTEVRQATVTSTVIVASVSGVASGSSTSGPGTGTATGTPN